QARRGPPDAVLRSDPAERRAVVRQGEFQGALRSHRARAGTSRESLEPSDVKRQTSNDMPIYHTLGKIPRKRHTAFRKPDGGIYNEQLVGHEGFTGTSSLLYHIHPPTTVKSTRRLKETAYEIDPDNSLRHRHFLTSKVKPGGSPTLDRIPLLFNKDIAMLYVEPTKADEHFYRNAQGDELVYVSKGN